MAPAAQRQRVRLRRDGTVKTMMRIAGDLGLAAGLWGVMYMGAVLFSLIGLSVGILSVAFLAFRTMRQLRRDACDSLRLMVSAVAIVAFAASMFLPLWRHPGFRRDESGQTVITWHSHHILNADHIH